MEKLHLKFCKRVLGVHSKSTNIAVFGELGRTPLIFQIAKLVIKYWFRIKSPSFSNTLVGEAAKACMELKLKPTMSCKNIKLLSLRSKFFEDLYKINSSFKLFSLEELFMYIMAMKDESIMKLVAKFCFEVLTTFDSVLE